MPSGVVRFGRFEVRLNERRLFADGRQAPLGARAFDVLAALIERCGRVVSRSELLDLVWPGLVVEEGNLTVQVSNLRKVLGTQVIASIPGRGYRFVAGLDDEIGIAATSPEGVAAAPELSPEPGSASSGEAPPVEPVHLHNLPLQLSSLVGREQNLAELRSLAGAARLVTLTGTGGLGKTRLALALAHELTPRYRDGVWFCDLSPVGAPALVTDVVAHALRVPKSTTLPTLDAVCEFARPRSLLVVLDNCEHLLPACARVAEALLRCGPHVAVLATSREPLHVEGEQVFPVPALSLPGISASTEMIAGSAAVELFVLRARSHQPRVALTPDNASAVAALCTRLDGIPLALELAAARIRTLSVEQMLGLLDDRLRLLVDVGEARPLRHQTLWNAIDWSCRLLAPDEQSLLARLAVFAGGWTLEAAQQVCLGETQDEWAVLETLSTLVDKSLVVAEDREGARRFSFLESVRQFAAERLRESQAGAHWQDRHLDWALSLAERAEPELTGAEQQRWLDLLMKEHDNLRAALAHARAVRGGDDRGLRLASALRRFWEMRGSIREGREWLAALLAGAPAEPPDRLRARALNAAGVLAWAQGDAAAAQTCYEASLALRRRLDDKAGIAGSLNNLGNVAVARDDLDAAQQLYEDALVLYRDVGDRSGIRSALSNLGSLASARGEIALAEELASQSLVIDRELGDRRGVATRLNNLAVQAEIRGNWARAEALYGESLGMRRALGDRDGMAASLCSLGRIALERGDLPAAGSLQLQGLRIRREIGDRRGMAFSIEGLADNAAARGDTPLAARLWGGAERLREAIGVAMPPGMRERHRRLVEGARAVAAGGEHAFDEAWQRGRGAQVEQLIDEGLAGEP